MHHADTYVIGIDSEIKKMVQHFNFTFISEDVRAGLNNALSTCLQSLSEKNDSALILPADIPLIEPKDVNSILQLKDEFNIVICPSKDTIGTNALFLRPPNIIEPQFGINSFQNHLKEAALKKIKIKILKNNRIAQDVDGVNDLKCIVQINKQIQTVQFLFKANIFQRLN